MQVKKQATSAQHALKGQATRLQQYLKPHVVLKQTVALEALCHALHGKPWNVVQAGLAAGPTPAQQEHTTVMARTNLLTYRTVGGSTKPLALLATQYVNGGTVSHNITDRVNALSDEQVMDLFTTQDQWLVLQGRFTEPSDENTGSLSELRKPYNADKLFLWAKDDRDSFAVWLCAFRPHLLLAYLAFRMTGSTEGLHDTFGLSTYSVDVHPGIDGSAERFGIRMEPVEPWSGTVEVIQAPVPVAKTPEQRVAGRSDDASGAPLIVGDKPLTFAELKAITDNGKFYVSMLVETPFDQLIGVGIDELNDWVSEAITGSSVDLEDISYDAAPAGVSLPCLNKAMWLHVIAEWAPMDPPDEDDESMDSTD